MIIPIAAVAANKETPMTKMFFPNIKESLRVGSVQFYMPSVFCIFCKDVELSFDLVRFIYWP